MSQLPSALKNSRCILHIDLDCFYCQVEQVRLGIPFDVPAAVQQWHGLIAVNYGARKAGIAKMTNVNEARRLCPQIRLIHTATYGPNDTEPRYYTNPNRNTHKVSLKPYRDASQKIFKIFHKHCDTVQKIGTDEGFMDVTSIVNQRLKERYIDRMPELLDKMDDQICDVYVDWDKLGNICVSREEEDKRATSDEDTSQDQKWSPTTWRDLQLALGAELAAEIRKEVYDTLHYTCSAGIAHYKVTAKLCSSRNKPNKQTVLRECARLDFMRDVPFKKIRNLGGKLGNEVGSDLEILQAAEVWKYDVEELQYKYGKSTGLYLYNICRGVDDEEVIAAKAPKSLMVAKTFTKPVTRPEDLQHWFSILSVELHERIIRHHEEFGTWPKNISLKYATHSHQYYKSKSIGSLHKDEMKTFDTLAKRFQQAYNSLGDSYPCIGLDLMATGLVHDESSKSHTINKFFNKSEHSAHDANGFDVPDEIVVDKQPIVPEKKPNSLFFTREPAVAERVSTSPTIDANTKEEELAETWTCDKCKQTILITELDEHTDYHFALDLQKEDRLPPSTASSSSFSNPFPSSAKKRKASTKKGSPSTTSESDKKKKISTFFQPRSS